MNKLYILGFGCGNKSDITLRTIETLKKSDRVFTRTMQHPSACILDEYSIPYTSFDEIYDNSPSFEEVYEKICDTILSCNDNIVSYIVPGSAVVAEKSVNLLLEKANCDVEIVPAVSFLDGIFADLKTDAITSFKMLDALSLEIQHPDVSCLNIICQIYDKEIASDVKLELGKYYNDETIVYLVTASSTNDKKIEQMKLYEIDYSNNINHLTSLVIPPQNFINTTNNFESLVQIITTLRGEHGCPWDKSQTHESLTPYVIEEAYEVVDAINKNDIENLTEELGDLLLQVLLHSQIAKEKDEFTIYDVINTVSQKMIRRHPHVFTDANIPQNLNKDWEEIKKEEHHNSYIFEEMNDIAESLPALMYAEKVQRKAAKVNFDFKNIDDAFGKIIEEYNEVKEAILTNNEEGIQRECGDLLFSAVNVLRLCGMSNEETLKKCTHRFMKRFEYVEKSLAFLEKNFDDVSDEELDSLWIKAKSEV